jgi:signal peptidase II
MIASNLRTKKRDVGFFIRFGTVIAALTVLADQATKYLVVKGLGLRSGDLLTVTPFFDLVLAMNRGISYGLFQQDSNLGRLLLVIVNLAAAGLFTFWLFRAKSRLLAAALGLLIGGALGNAIDRSLYGAVIDFVSLHALGWRWYVFNIADAAIVAGVIGLLYDATGSHATK